MDDLERILNQYAEQGQRIHNQLRLNDAKVEALIRFKEGYNLTDRQKELVAEVLKKRRQTLEQDLSKVEDNVGVGFEMAGELQEMIDSLNERLQQL